jgi:hypothetical protein
LIKHSERRFFFFEKCHNYHRYPYIILQSLLHNNNNNNSISLHEKKKPQKVNIDKEVENNNIKILYIKVNCLIPVDKKKILIFKIN